MGTSKARELSKDWVHRSANCHLGEKEGVIRKSDWGFRV